MPNNKDHSFQKPSARY